MQQVVIENPILNSPFEEPCRHFRFSDDGITDDIACCFIDTDYNKVINHYGDEVLRVYAI